MHGHLICYQSHEHKLPACIFVVILSNGGQEKFRLTVLSSALMKAKKDRDRFRASSAWNVSFSTCLHLITNILLPIPAL